MRPLSWIVLVALCGCAEDVPTYTAPAGLVQAVFDPSYVDPVTRKPAPKVPTPTDLIKDPLTGLLAIPATAATAPAAQKEFDAYLRTLDGFPTGSTAEVRFSGKLLDSSVVADKSVVVLDVTNKKSVTRVTGLTLTYTAASDGTSRVTIKNPKGWTRASTYALYVLGGAGGVRDAKNKKGVIRAPLFELAAAPKPLCEWDAQKYWYAVEKLCSGESTRPLINCRGDTDCDDEGATGVCTKGTCTEGVLSKKVKVQGRRGCCVYNYSSLIATAVQKSMDSTPTHKELSLVQQQAAVKVETLARATDFERMRAAYGGGGGLLDAAAGAGLVRDDVALAWSFSTLSMSEVLYDPAAGTIPFPNDLLYDAANKKVNIPAPASETAAEKQLRLGLNSLDGFSTQGSAFAGFVGTIDVKTVKLLSGVIVAEASGTPVMDATVKVVDTAPAIVITPSKPLKEKTQYAVVLVSKRAAVPSKKAAAGLTDAGGNRLAASSFLAMIRSRAALTRDGKSTISSLDDATAKQLETARLAHKKLFDLLETNSLLPIKREDVVAAWAFTTQSITAPLTKMRALPWQVLAAADAGAPTLAGTLDDKLTGYPAGKAKNNIAAWVQKGTFTSYNLLDQHGSAAFYPDQAKCPATICKATTVPFSLAVPKGTMPANGWPVVLYQHGGGRGRLTAMDLADDFAATGIATLAFDAVYHGDRTWCQKDSHCTAGTCVKGACSAGKLADTDGDGIPDASGDRFLTFANPFAIRDNIRQHVIDAAALLRALSLGGAGAIKDGAGKANAVQLDKTRVYYASQSLGSIMGTLVLAADPLPSRAALNVPGAPLVDIVLTSPGYKADKDALLKANDVKEGTLGYLRLANTFHWIMDPADPGNFARYTQKGGLEDQVLGASITSKEVMIQLAGKDQTVPLALGQYLAKLMEVTVTDTTYEHQGHGFLHTADPAGTSMATTAARKQVIEFFTTGKVCKPDVKAGTCGGK